MWWRAKESWSGAVDGDRDWDWLGYDDGDRDGASAGTGRVERKRVRRRFRILCM